VKFAIGRRTRVGGAFLVVAALVLIGVPGSAPALVNPVTLIQQQIIKPNMLIVFDTSTSMINSPGDKDVDLNEVGMDCDDGVDCRTVGMTGRCYLTGAGAMGSGVKKDYTPCTADAQCRRGYCKSSAPTGCTVDSDCGSGNTCVKRCSNNTATSCTSNSNCSSGGVCGKLCSNDTSGTLCTTDADCPNDDYCSVFANDTCMTTGAPEASKICQVGQNRCKTNADCPTSGDSCGPGTSRLVVAKRVVGRIVAGYYTTVNFGLMTFYQDKYYPYYPTSGSIVNNTVTRFIARDELGALGCWTKKDGPASSCVINGQTYNRRANPDSTFRVKTGKDTYSDVDANWCSSVWCPVTGGTGYYQGSFFTYTDPQASLSSTTPLVLSTYQGKTYTQSGTKYIYWDPPIDMRNQNDVYGDSNGPEPIAAGDTTGTLPCLANMGGRADTTVAPFMDTTNNATKAQAMANAIIAKMDKAGLGGIGAEGFTPTGCTLAYDNTSNATSTNNALNYMKAVKASDTTTCRNNYVLLVTDGSPNRTYDANCDDAKCSAADPTAAGCTCWAVKAAQQLKANGITTFVIGFSATLSGAYPTATLNNMAKAGGSGTAYFATREDELYTAITSAIYEAAKGSYSTAPAAASSGTQSGTSVTMGTMLLDTRAEFPGWKGQVIAYETSSGTPTVAWSASKVAYDYGCPFDPTTHVQPSTCPDSTKLYYASYARQNEWKTRNIWTSNGTTMVKIDLSSGSLASASTLVGLGLGANTTEADRIARWMAGDPSMRNPAVLGAVINSTPIDVGPVGNSPLPGGAAFYALYGSRPNLTYLGASDGMLHAFFTKDVTIGGTTYKGGQEAFAYLPQTMLAVESKLFAQNGQLPDPANHIYGLANSPKVKSFCTANCDGLSGTPVWKTVLIMAYGFGGTEAFTLDITNPFTTSGVKTTAAPAPMIWSTQYLSSSTTSAYDNDLGLTTSVPAFFYGKSASKSDFRVMFGSYYLDTATGSMGKVVIETSAQDGTMIDAPTVNPSNSCTQAFGLLSDVAAARNFTVSEETQILASYFGDTWGNLYRYVPNVGTSNYTLTSGNVSALSLTSNGTTRCQHPVHYAPAVVQLDRDNATNRPGEIYLVQVTNSALDTETIAFPASRMVVMKDLASGGAVAADPAWTNLDLSAGTTLGGVPATARPNATPLVVLRQDGQGFEVISTWYVPAVNACSDGVTYLNIYDINVMTNPATATLKYSGQLASEPVTSAVFVGGKLMFASQNGVTDLSSILPAGLKFVNGAAGVGGSNPDRFRRLGWNELP
jgi:hypothetical protein